MMSLPIMCNGVSSGGTTRVGIREAPPRSALVSASTQTYMTPIVPWHLHTQSNEVQIDRSSRPPETADHFAAPRLRRELKSVG